MCNYKKSTNLASGFFPNWRLIKFTSLVTTVCFGVLHSLIAVDPGTQESPEKTAPEKIENLTLKNALALALKGNPELIGYEYDLRAAEARILQAGLRPNPSFDAEMENFAGSGAFRGANAAETTLSLGQLIELGDKRKFRTNLARSNREVSRLEYEIKKREVLVQTTLQFIEVLEAQRRITGYEEIVDMTKRFEPTIKKRIEAGKGNPLEATKSKIAISSAKIELDRAKQALLSAREKLSNQWGVLEPQFLKAIGKFESLESIAPLQQLRGRLKMNPRIMSYEGEAAHAMALMNMARAEGKPDVKILAGVRQHNLVDDTALLLGFSVPLPLFNRNQGEIMATRAEHEKVKAQLNGVVVQLSAQLSDAYRRLSSSRAEIEVLQDEVIPSAESAQKQAMEGYQVGLFRYIEVLDAQRTLSAARLQLIHAFSNYRVALAQIEGLIGAPGLKNESSE